MEGSGRVRDGSKKSPYKNPVIGNGYYWLNAVMVNDEEILLVYSDICNLDREAKYYVSENTKINDITNMVYEINPDAIFVIDRKEHGSYFDTCHSILFKDSLSPCY